MRQTAKSDPLSSDIALAPKPADWLGLLEAIAQDQGDDLLIERRPAPSPPKRRDPFED